MIGKYVFSFYIDSNKLAVKFKTIIKESGVEYKDVLNYTLSILNSKTERILAKFDNKYGELSQKQEENILTPDELLIKVKLEEQFTHFIFGYIDFIFFLYSVSPRVNSSIKLSSILSQIIKYYNGSNHSKKYLLNEIHKDLIFKKN